MIYCCGESLIDMIPEETNGVIRLRPASGGSLFNTAIALGRLGADVGFVSGVSNDLFGKQLDKELHASGVNTDLLVRSNRPTTLAFVELTNGHAEYNFYDENTAGRMLETADMPTLPDTAHTVFFGGISWCSEPAADAYLALAESVSGRARIMVDPNIRPSFVQDEARYRARLERFLTLADIVKISDEDLDWVFPNGDAMAQLKAFDPAAILFTQGGDGATAYLRDGSNVSVKAPKVTVVDTVGAGDTFSAGFLAELGTAELNDQAAIKSALEFAAKVAAVTVSRLGADPPWRKELS